MIDIAGPFLLVLMVTRGITVHELPSQADCEAVRTQLESNRYIHSYCVAARAVKEDKKEH